MTFKEEARRILWAIKQEDPALYQALLEVALELIQKELGK